MAMQEIFVRRTRGDQTGGQFRFLGLLLGGGSLLALVTIYGFSAAHCDWAGGDLQLSGFGPDCFLDARGTIEIPALIPIAG